MGRSSPVATLTALVLIPLALGCDSPDAGPVEPPRQPLPLEPGWDAYAWPTAPTGRFEDVFFLDENHGWLAYAGGSIYRTANGGAGWDRVSVAEAIFPQAVGFVTPEIGWFGDLNELLIQSTSPPGAPLYETLDGGDTWHDVSARIDGPRPVGISGIFVLNRDNIYAVGRLYRPAFFMRSNDGGATWKSSDLTPLADGLVDVHFFDRSNGIAVGGVGEEASGSVGRGLRALHAVVLRTEDGGDSWRQVYRGQTEAKWAWKISFPTPSIGYVATQGYGRPAVSTVLRTEDGGRTWREIAVGPAFEGFAGIGFISSDTGWAAAEQVIYRTNDGGRSWSEATFGERVNRIRFLPSGIGYAVGRRVHRFNPYDGHRAKLRDARRRVRSPSEHRPAEVRAVRVRTGGSSPPPARSAPLPSAQRRGPTPQIPTPQRSEMM